MNKVMRSRYSPQDIWEDVKKMLIVQKKRGYKFTKKQLAKWNLKYSKLIFGKPSYDLYIDDKSIFLKRVGINLLIVK